MAEINRYMVKEILDINKNFAGMDLSGLDLAGLDFTRANLKGVNLMGANLEGANFRKANLRKANLMCANLEKANLEDANLDNTFMRYTRLNGANFGDPTRLLAEPKSAKKRTKSRKKAILRTRLKHIMRC